MDNSALHLRFRDVSAALARRIARVLHSHRPILSISHRAIIVILFLSPRKVAGLALLTVSSVRVSLYALNVSALLS